MSAPHFTTLTQYPVVINLSRPAMEWILRQIGVIAPDPPFECELDNFKNLLQNLLERSEPKLENFDLIGA